MSPPPRKETKTTDLDGSMIVAGQTIRALGADSREVEHVLTPTDPVGFVDGA